MGEKILWQPGTSPNPGGKPRDTPEMKKAKAAAKAATPDMVAVLVDIAKNGENESARVMAADKVLDRAFGKPVQQVTGEDGAPLFAVSGDVLRLEVMRALQRFAAPPPVDTTAIVLPALPESGEK